MIYQILLILDPDSYVIPEVWKIIDTKMEKENKDVLFENLKVSEKIVFHDPRWYKMLHVPWDELKSELESFDEQEIIKEIQNTTYITRGTDFTSNALLYMRFDDLRKIFLHSC